MICYENSFVFAAIENDYLENGCMIFIYTDKTEFLQLVIHFQNGNWLVMKYNLLIFTFSHSTIAIC